MIESRRFWVDSQARARKVADEIARLDVGPGRVAEVIVRPPRREKTTDQRGLFHSICSDIGLELGNTPGQIKHAIKFDFYGLDEYSVGGDIFFQVQSSEDSDRAEYGRLIDHAYAWAAERGVRIQDRRQQQSNSTTGAIENGKQDL